MTLTIKAVLACLVMFATSCSSSDSEPPHQTSPPEPNISPAAARPCNCNAQSRMQFDDQTDREVAAWLDLYEPFEKMIVKKSTEIYFDLLGLRSKRAQRSADSRGRAVLCNNINVLLLDIADWHYANPRPCALIEGIAAAYALGIGRREWGNQHVKMRVPLMWGNFVWSGFGGRNEVFRMRQWVEELGCDLTADRTKLQPGDSRPE